MVRLIKRIMCLWKDGGICFTGNENSLRNAILNNSMNFIHHIIPFKKNQMKVSIFLKL